MALHSGTICVCLKLKCPERLISITVHINIGVQTLTFIILTKTHFSNDFLFHRRKYSLNETYCNAISMLSGSCQQGVCWKIKKIKKDEMLMLP